MKQRTSKNELGKPEETPLGEMRIAVRITPPLSGRFDRVQRASKRSKTSIVDECLQNALPALEKQFGLTA